MTEAVVKAEHVGKRYQIGARESYGSLRESLSRALTSPFRFIASRYDSPDGNGGGPRAFWALKDVSFELSRGDVLGVIGANGAGKSTLLKILSRIAAPTEGEIEIEGRVGSLLEVGTGFHHELTGRENIYLNGAILGMKRAEIVRRFDEIVAFAGIEKFVDTPVKHYSSGMYMRLAFAVAAHLDTEILMVDEVLAVGDASFQLKCLNKMSEVSGSGRTILFVSHNMEAVNNLCTRGLLLNQGKVARIGSPQECIDEYLMLAKERKPAGEGVISLRNHPGRTKQHNGPVRLTGIRILDAKGRPSMNVQCGEAMSIAVQYELLGSQAQNVMFVFTFSNFYNNRIASCRSNDTHLETLRIEGPGQAVCHVPRLPLVPGHYRLSLLCNTEAGHSDGVYDAAVIEVTGSNFYPSGMVPMRAQGEVLFDHEWEIHAGALPAAAERTE
jgi:lipopolysaccharide transport system ATP-binding protein